MDENDFSRFGQSIKDGIAEAVNTALDSMDFSGLSEKIADTADNIISETVETFTGKSEKLKEWQRYFGKEREKTDEKKLELRYSNELPGRVSGIIRCTFGGIGIGCFGTPLITLMLLGLTLWSPSLLFMALFIFAPLTGASAILLKGGCERLGLIKHFKAYKRCIGPKALCAIKTLSQSVGKSEAKVKRELRQMIAKGYFLQAHIDDEETCLILDDETYKFYLQSKKCAAKEEKKAAKKAEKKAKKKEKDKMQEKAKEASDSFTNESGESSHDKRVEEAIQVGMDYIRRIRKINDELPQPVISEKLSHLEEVIGLIYLRVQKSPEKLDSLKRFTDYYLPTTMRLVTAYSDLDKVETDNARQSKEQIEQTLDTINAAFDKLLDGLYEEDRMNIQTDISVLKTLLAQEGLTDDGFGII